MPIRNTTSEAKIAAHIDEHIRQIDKAIIRSLSVVAEQVLNAARSTNSYKDQTGNLRSSLGYVIVRDGEIVTSSSFAQVKGGKQGADIGRDYANKLASESRNGYVLIVVAGMNYAFYVKKKGYDVIDSAELLAEQLVPKMLKELKLTR